MKNFTTELSIHSYKKVGAKKVIRRLSDLQHLYESQKTIEEILNEHDPVLYEVYELPQPALETDLLVNITVLYPGSIGQEPYMTKGHFHEKPDNAEVVIGLEGTGILVLQNRDGKLEKQPVKKGFLNYASSGWGHRVINTGKENLVFLSISSADIIHDYETAAKFNFKPFL